MMLRRRLEYNRKEEIGSWGKFGKEELHNLYPSTNIIRVIK
jgi:hypothetical protein